jgi:hypothetical protein
MIKQTIILTPEQQAKLETIQKLADEANESNVVEDRRGMIFAQVWPYRGHAIVFFVPHPQADQLIEFFEYLKGTIK